jgi:hypothetical protein
VKGTSDRSNGGYPHVRQVARASAIKQSNMTQYKCPICDKLIEPAREQFTYAVVEKGSCRFENIPSNLSSSARVYQIHDVCTSDFENRVANGSY